MLEQPTPLHIKILKVVLAAAAVLALCGLTSGCDSQLESSSFDATGGASQISDATPLPPVCDVPPGYLVFGESCGGSKINGFACATGCVIAESSGGADAGRTPLAVGCRLPDRIGIGAICVADCRDCQ